MLDIQKIETAVNMISQEKKIPKEKIIEIIESALKTAYKKDYGTRDENVNVKLDLDNWSLEISIEKTVVKTVENPSTEISFEELGDDAEWFEEGDIVEIDVTDEIMKGENAESFWRIASQAARQVIIQKMWETEKEKLYDLFADKQGQVINMKIDIVEWWKVIFDYNGNKVILPKSEQVSRDNYAPGNRFYLYVAEVSKDELKGSRVTLSRKRPELVSGIFKEIVPEIEDGIVTIDKVVRQPGIKTKMLVSTTFDEIDPVGTLIGQKGMRVKSVMEELGWEKIDIVPNVENAEEVVKKALSPAEVVKVVPGDDEDSVIAYIKAWERARAVWKWGLNVNLASKLTWFKISVKEMEAEKKEEE